MSRNRNKSSRTQFAFPLPGVQFRTPGLPDCQKDPAAWLAATDGIVNRVYMCDPSVPLPRDHHRGKDETFFKGILNKDVLQEIINSRRLFCVSHLHISQAALAQFVVGDFENKWVALGRKDQELHIFKAFQDLDLESASDVRLIHGAFDIGKLHCPELCAAELFADNGLGYVRLLKRFLLDNNHAPPVRPLVLENKRFNEIIGWQGEDDVQKNRKVVLGLRRSMRTEYICSFCMHVLVSYEGNTLKRVRYTNEHFKTKEALEIARPVMNTLLGPAAAKQWHKEEASKRKELVLFCSACLQPEDKTKTGKMGACARCRAIGREIRYCNRECQRAAWGSHKRECGKPYDVDSAMEEVVPFTTQGIPPPLSSRPDIPPSRPGFVRPPHLIRQINYLIEHQSKDYIVIMPSPDRNSKYQDLEGISLDVLQGAATFVAMRNRIMSGFTTEEGMDQAMLYMYRVLQKCIMQSRVDDSVVHRQLAREFGDVWERVYKADRSGVPAADLVIGRAEIDEAVMGLKAVGRFKDQLKDYVPGEGGVLKCSIQVGPEKDVTVITEFPRNLFLPHADGFDLQQLLQLIESTN